jgi:glycosyltransferase involved in cell wall biosynthesis
VNLSITVVVSCYNQSQILAQILTRLAQGSIIPAQVRIADDGSDKTTSELINNLTQACNLNITHHWQKDLGFRKCKILNQSIKSCDSDYVVLLDGDCLPHKHFVKDHMNLAKRGYFIQGRRCFIKENAVACFLEGKASLLSLILAGKVSGLLKSIRLLKPVTRINQEMYGLLGCNLGAWRRDLLSVNGFDEDYEGWGREDSDLGARLYNLGLKRKLVYGRALVYHLNHPENKRDYLEENDKKLEETISRGKIRCTNGLVKD